VNDKPSSRYQFSIVRDRLRRHPAPYLDFVFGRHKYPLPAVVEATVREAAELALRPRTSDEVEAFARTACDFLSRTYGVEASPSAILPTPGGRAALGTLAATLISPGETVVVTAPGYPVFDRVAAQSNARVRSVTLDPDRHFDPALGSSDGDPMGPVRILALNYPNNPTGAVPSATTISEMQRHFDTDTIWFNDATYGPLTYGERPFSLLARDPAGSGDLRVLELHSLAKLFPLGPLSSSFLVGDESLIEPIRDYSDFAWSPMSALQLRVARECLDQDDHVEQMREDLRERLARLSDVLSDLGFHCFPVQGGTYQLCRAPVCIGDRPVRGAGEAAEVLLTDHDVAAVPFEVGPHAYVRFSALYLTEELKTLAGLGRGQRLVQS